MEWPVIILITIGVLVVVFLSGFPVAFCFMLLNLVGVFFLWGGVGGLQQFILNMFSSVAVFTLLPIPFFILLGELLFHSGVALSMLDALDKWLGKLRGRLALLSVGTATLFSTMSGSTIGTTAMLGSLLVPEMEKRGYRKSMSLGPIMGSGGLAMLIPPSGIAVFLASLAEVSIAKLLIAGIIPGLIVAILYSSYIVIRCRLQPHIAPVYEVARVPTSEKIRSTVLYVLPGGLIIFMILGLMFLGIATPTEAAVTGCLGSLILAAGNRRLNWIVLKKSLWGTLRITSMIFMIIAGAKTFSQILVFTGALQELVNFAVSLPIMPILIVVGMECTLLFMGCFMDVFGMMMITVPIFFPIIYALGFDPIWFALLMLLNVEMANTTPPFGILLFVMKGAAPPGTTMGDVYRAGFPFLLCDAMAMALFIVFPILVLWMPSMM